MANFVKIDENELGEIWINIDNILFIKDRHLEVGNNPHIAYEIHTVGGVLYTYHDIPEIKSNFIV